MVMANPNIHSLNALVTGYIKNDKPKASSVVIPSNAKGGSFVSQSTYNFGFAQGLWKM